MLENPLKKYKRFYPVDFNGSNKKQIKKQSISKYDFTRIENQQNNSNFFHHIYPANSNQNPEADNQYNLNNTKEANYQQENGKIIFQQNQNVFKNNFRSKFDSINIENPLQQINKKQKILIDANLLANPRFQNKDKQQLLNMRTFESISPNLQSKTRCGNIKHQNLHNFHSNIKQQPLQPQNPFKIGVHSQKQKYLQKLGINQNFYIKKNLNLQKRNHLNKIDMRRANSSFQMKINNQKMISNQLFNKEYHRDNLPNVFNRSLSKFSNLNQQTAKYHQHLKKTDFSKTNNNIFNNQKRQQISSQLKFQPGFITKVKQQINEKTQRKMKKRNNSMDEKLNLKKDARQYTFNQDQNQKCQGHNQKHETYNQNGKKLPKIQITYHTTLVSLKNIVKNFFKESFKFQLSFKIPKIFIDEDLFYKQQQKQQLHLNSLKLFETLKIPSKNMITKRYSNCILFISENIIVIWHYNGKRFLGGWQYKYLNQGSKHGLGLQWQPNSHIYYGEFKENKKHGIGAMKQEGNTITVGYWFKGRYVGQFQNEENLNEQEINSDEDWRSSTQLRSYGLQSSFNKFY